MKFKEIKPGMVIHCPTEEDARALLEHLDSLGYTWESGEKLFNEKNAFSYRYSNSTCYMIGIYEPRIGIIKKEDTWKEITEFSDLIEPDTPINSSTDSPMSAVEVLEWFQENYNHVNLHCNGFDEKSGFGQIMKNHTSQEIIDKITAYEAAKKKPVELEWVNVCRIYRIYETGYYEFEEVLDLPDNAWEIQIEEILRKYISEHEGNYYATVERRCQRRE